MVTKTKTYNKRIYHIALLCAIVFLFVVYKLFITIFVEGDELRAKGEEITFRIENVKAIRGNIYSSDGSLLATSVQKYDIFIDPLAPSKENFEKYIKPLSDSLAVMFGDKTPTQYENYYRKLRSNKVRYVQLAKRMSYTDYVRLKKFPLFKLGRYKGGIVIEARPFREHPMGEVASRTIGYERIDADGNIVRRGIEAAYSNYLSGKDGKRAVRKMSKGMWKPINDENFVQPEDGLDIVTTIDVYIQDIAHHALLDALQYYEASYGCVVVMDVETGFVRAIANLSYSEKQGKYIEANNHAVLQRGDAGSVFKLASYMAMLDLGKVDSGRIFDTHGGILRFADRFVRDSHAGGYGKISFARGFEVSSNTVVTQAVSEAFKNDPLTFINKLETFGFNHTSGLDLSGELPSYIPRPGDKAWSAIALPWMSYGYGIEVSPIQLLMMYNAVANGGELLSPRFVQEIRKVDKTVKKFGKTVINPQIVKPEVINQMREMMKNVVLRGTAKVISKPYFPMAGKTGTMKLGDSTSKGVVYTSSFAGYFPLDKPKYSCIVSIHRPTKHSYYGADVAGPVFKRLAQKIYTDTPSLNKIKERKEAYENTKRDYNRYKRMAASPSGKLPNVVGLPAMDAIALLENANIKVRIVGRGKVISQSVAAGEPIKDVKQITLELQ